LYIQSGEYTGGNLILTRNNNTTVTIPVPETNHIVGGSIDGRVITLVRENGGTPVTIQLPADANTYPVSAEINGNTLTITNSDGSTVPVTLPTDNDHYVTGGSISGNTLTLTRNGGLSDVTVQLPAWKITDNDHYPDTMTVDSSNVLHLTGTNFNALQVQLPSTPSDTTNPIVDVSQSGTTVTFTYKDNTSETINTGGDTTQIEQDIDNIEGDITNIQQDLTSILRRLTALEGLWEINPNDNSQVIAKNGRSAMAAGFYDSTVNTV
jgi:hypothetical protein